MPKMFEMQANFSLLLWLWLTIFGMFPFTIISASSIAKPGCPTTCGNVIVPYPFGIGLDGACSLSQPYNMNCNTSYDPPKLFIGETNMEIMDISDDGQMRIVSIINTACYNKSGHEVLESGKSKARAYIKFEGLPFVFSDTANKFTVIGCDEMAFITDAYGHGSACMATCYSLEDVIQYNGSCSGVGCCQTPILKGVDAFLTRIQSFKNHTNISDFNQCGAAFIGEENKFTFNVADLSDHSAFMNRTRATVPVVLDWFVGENETCHEARKTPSRSGYACQEKTNCTDFDAGSRSAYRCSCLPGYDGNPYLSPGCTDVDECVGPSKPCSHICTNTPGRYKCSCPKGYKGNGLKNGTGCFIDHSGFATRLSLGMSFGFLFLVIVMSWIYFITKKRKLMKKREKFFEQNGGILMTQQLSLINGGTMESSKLFSAQELKAATNNYREDCILGKGGYGTVYKGLLKDGREVAIKKSKVADQTQVEQFINEVVILTQINHRNVVKLLGCCLETEVPLLVYEVISNGTLFEHIHRYKGMTSWLTWANCIRLAAEAADALMYLHSAASIPIIHRDVKSTNILLDENYTAKISDFGASRLVPMDQTQVTTLVQGTLGYLDPQYFHTSQLTEKSDVYSFGVVLAELLTKEKPLCSERKMEERNLATYFIVSMKEDRLLEILDPQLVREASEEQLVTMAKLVKKCLNIKGEDRPSMKEVALELEGLKKQNRHPWAEQKYEETTGLIGQHDLYPVPSNGDLGSKELSRQNPTQMDIVTEMNNPR